MLALTARTGIASVMLADGDLAGARSYYQQLAADGAGNAAVQAAADNGLAECDFRDPSRLKEAQRGFAEVAISSAGVPAERARALYFLGQCAQRLGEQDREPGARQKADAYYQEVVTRYPDTRWAGLARQAQR
jgi:TolA-binding protein